MVLFATRSNVNTGHGTRNARTVLRVFPRARSGGRGAPADHVRQFFHADGDVVDLRLDHVQKVGRQSRGVVGRGQAGRDGRLDTAGGRSAATMTAQQVAQT